MPETSWSTSRGAVILVSNGRGYYPKQMAILCRDNLVVKLFMSLASAANQFLSSDQSNIDPLMQGRVTLC